MNTNSNTYTVIYTTVVCVLVAAVLAFVSQTLGPRQVENMKAETISQILEAAKFEKTTIDSYKEEIESAVVINANGEVVKTLDVATAEVYSTSDLKAQNKNILNKDEVNLPVYIFKNGVSVIPVYGAGLWGPVWGYVAFQDGAIKGVVFDHASETPGLGGKIKEDPAFAAQFVGKTANFESEICFSIVKGGAKEGDTHAVDAISGATMTSKGLDAAINVWLGAYKAYFAEPKSCCGEQAEAKAEHECCGKCQNSEN